MDSPIRTDISVPGPSSPPACDFGRSGRGLRCFVMLLLFVRATSTSTTTHLWPLEDPAWRGTSKSNKILRCDPGRTQECFLKNPKPLEWRSAHAFCRQQGGFLASRDEIEALKDVWPSGDSPEKGLTQDDFIWTALTMLAGHYQWLSHHPIVAEFVAWKDGRIPPLWSRDCAAFNVTSQQFDPRPCTASLASFCYLPSPVAPSDVELRVASSLATVDEWINVDEEQWRTFHLTCEVHDPSTGALLEGDQPIFWSKDGVYIDSKLPTLFPDLVFSRTKSTGTYWCETWAGRSPDPLSSNKVLVTHEDWLVLILVAHRSLEAETSVSDAILELRRYLAPHFPDVNSYPLDLISVERNSLFKYRFQLHIFNVSESLERVKDFSRERNYRKTGDLNTYTAALSTYCQEHEEEYRYGNTIRWPFTPVGKVHPLNYRCETSDGWLRAGHCQWNYTHGASVTFDSSQCRRFEQCPRGYDSVSNLCVSTTEPQEWERGLRSAYSNDQERDLLARRLIEEGQPSVYESTKEMLRNTKNLTRVWLPIRRLVPFGPLTFVGVGSPNLSFLRKENSSYFSGSWAAGHPRPEEDCLALDLKEDLLLTQPCDAHLPFVALFSLSRIRNGSLPMLITEGFSSCPRNWLSTGYHKQGVCFRMFKGVENSTWEEARQYCEEKGAKLATPAVGFLDWVYRLFLRVSNVESVWMSLEHLGTAYAPERVQLDYVNWKADVNQSLQFPVLTDEGWSREGSSSAKTNILCQRSPRGDVHIAINSSLGTQCVEISHEEMIVDGVTSVRCFVNGERTNLTLRSTLGCRLDIVASTQGYFQCLAWAWSPFRLVKSKALVYREPNTLTYVISSEEKSAYDPKSHDRTFYRWSRSKAVPSAHLKVLRRLSIPPASRRIEGIVYSRAPSSGKLRISVCVAMGFTEEQLSSLTEESVLRELKDSASRDVYSTVGCQPVVTDDYGQRKLTWARVEGRATVFPEELCVTSGGEVVTRQCLGSFLLGYMWGPTTGNCSGEPSNVTERLWDIRRTDVDSPEAVAKELSELSSDGTRLRPADVDFMATIFQSLSRKEIHSQHGFENVVDTFNNIMETDSEAFRSLSKGLHPSTVLVESLEAIAFQVKLPEEEQSLKVTRELVTVERVNLGRDSRVIGFKSKTSTVPEDATIREIGDFDHSVTEAAIVLPKGLTSLAINESGATNKVHLTFAVYRTPKLFQDNESYPNFTVNSQIIQASYNDVVLENLDEPVTLFFRPLRQKGDLKCVFWDVRDSQKGSWSTEGCLRGKPAGNRETCLCNHLTSFALLINYDDQDHPGIHGEVLSAITMVGCSVSILGLLTVFMTFLLFEKWRRPLKNKILVNLCLAIFCSLVIFLAGIGQTWNRHLCRAVAVGIHYFVLASFGWMLVEAVHQYIVLVKVINTYIPKFLWKASLGAWGAPVPLIVAILVYDPSLYESTPEDQPYARICWMSSWGFKRFFLPPLALTMAVNAVVFAVIIYRVTCGRTRITSTQKERDLIITQISVTVCLFFLLGFTWVFGLLSYWKFRPVFSYFFCVFNTLQGFFIFVFHVLRDRMAKGLWKDFTKVLRAPPSSINPSKEGTSHMELMKKMRHPNDS